MSCFNNLANIYNNKIIKPHFLKTQPKSKIIEYLTRQKLLRPHTHDDKENYKKDGANFGYSVAINDKYIVVGAPSGDADNKQGNNTENNIIDQGYVEVFEIKKSGKIIKYTKGDAFQDDGTIRPHTHYDKEIYKKDNANFGRSVAISDKYIVVGAPFGVFDSRGYVEVFEITSTGIHKFSKGNAFQDDGTIRPHTHPENNDSANFGWSVAINDKYIVVGARWGDADNKEGDFTKNNIPNQGFVEVFEITKSGIHKFSKGNAFETDGPAAGTIRPHTHPDKKDWSEFGTSVAISDKYIIVGAYTGNADNIYNEYFRIFDNAGNINNPIGSLPSSQGYVEVFEITSNGINKYSKGNAFQLDGTIRPHTHDDKENYKKDNASFGYSVAISDKYIVVGAPYGDADNKDGDYTKNNIPGQGYVEVFEITKSGINKFKKGNVFEKDDGTIRPHTHPDKKDYTWFGYSVAINDKYIVVGAPFGDADNNEGSAYEQANNEFNGIFFPYNKHNNKNNIPYQGYVEVFKITSSGINKFSKGSVFEKDKTIRPHTHADKKNYKKDSLSFGISVALNDHFLIAGAPWTDADDIEGNNTENNKTGQGLVEVFQFKREIL